MFRRPLKTYGKNPNRPISTTKKLIDYRHNVFESSDSDDDILKSNGSSHSTTNDPFESTFDRIARTAKLPPVPSDQNGNSSILYVSSSSSSSLTDENWIQNIKQSPKRPQKKITKGKRRKKTDPDKKIKVEESDRTQTLNRKRQNNLRVENNDKRTNVEASQPQRKARRASREHLMMKSLVSSNNLDTNPSSVITSPSANVLKSCCVELTRVNTPENSLKNDDELQPSITHNESFSHNENLITDTTSSQTPFVDHHGNKFTNIRDCRIVLSRLDVNRVMPSKYSLTPTPKVISSTPFNRRIMPWNLKPSFSPITDKPNDTVDVSSTTDMNDLSGIHDITDSTTNINRVKGRQSQKSSVIELKSCDSALMQSCNNHSPKGEMTAFPIHDEKSTELLFDTNDSIDKVNDNPNSVSNKFDSREKSTVLTEIEGKYTRTLSLSSDENKTRSMFEETKLEIDDTVDNSIPNEESYESKQETEQWSTNKSEIDSKIEDISASSATESKESNASLLSQMTNTINTVDSNDLKTSSDESSRTSNRDTSEDSYQLHVSNSSPNTSSSDPNSKETSQRKFIDVDSSGSSITDVDDELDHSNNAEPVVLLTRLSEPKGITKRRHKYVKWDHQLGTIAESSDKLTSIMTSNQNELDRKRSNVLKKFELSSELSEPRKSMAQRSSRYTRSHTQNENHSTTLDGSHNDDQMRMVYLKPGKSWARSLSILNHINNNDDIEMLSVGKGKRWQQSVKNVLDMQSQGVLQSCVKNGGNENDEYAASVGIHGSDVTRISSSTVTGTVESTSPGRFVRRVSIRVVPDKKYSNIKDKDMRDTSFLEVYGISRSKNRKTLDSRPTLIGQRNTLVYNLRCSNVNVGTVVPEPVVAARNVVLQRCNQADCVPFEECYPETFLEHCRKIGEGVYGEVFLFENRKEKSVIKIIPIEGEKLVNGEPQKKFCEILSEIIIAKELHDLRFHNVYRTSGFVEVKNIRCLIGKYPQKLIEHWQLYDEEKTSDNDCPSMFTDDQLYIALELGHGGKDLEAFVFQNATEAYSSFVQAALTLAVAEKSLDFEHRDLHWGNILISRTNETEMSYKLDTEEITFACKGLKVAIIDFTLSRMSYQGCCMFNDLALDPALFTAAGEYQFEIYRLMKAKVGNNWQLFEPYTNILWLHYTLDKMIMGVRYKKVITKIHKNGILKLQELKDELLNYDSAYDFITSCDKLSGLLRRTSSH